MDLQKKCAQCGSSSPVSALICPACGARLPQLPRASSPASHTRQSNVPGFFEEMWQTLPKHLVMLVALVILGLLMRNVRQDWHLDDKVNVTKRPPLDENSAPDDSRNQASTEDRQAPQPPQAVYDSSKRQKSNRSESTHDDSTYENQLKIVLSDFTEADKAFVTLLQSRSRDLEYIITEVTRIQARMDGVQQNAWELWPPRKYRVGNSLIVDAINEYCSSLRWMKQAIDFGNDEWLEKAKNKHMRAVTLFNDGLQELKRAADD